MGEDAGTVWYAGYGSNLVLARMNSYLLGGSVPGSHRSNAGSRVRRPAVDVVTCRIPGRLRFAGRFPVWGSGGGAAFYDPRAGGRSVLCRAYEITVSQLVDVVMQENGVDPGASPAATRRLEDAVATFLSGRDDVLDLDGHELDPYDRLVRVAAVTLRGSGHQFDVVLVARREPLPEAPPPPEYRTVILQGLREDVGLSVRQAEEYLAAFGG